MCCWYWWWRGKWRVIAKLRLWAQPLGVTPGCIDLLSHSLPLLTGQVERRRRCWKLRSDKENNSVYRRGRAPGVRPGPPASNTYLFALVNWELSVGIPLSLLLETAFLYFLHPPHSRSSWNLVFLLSSAPLAEVFGDRSSGALGSDLAWLSVHLVLSPAKIIHIIHTNINNCIPTQIGFVLHCLTLCLPSPNDLQKF